MTPLLPWERLLWSSRPWRLARIVAAERYLLTDFRIVAANRRGIFEIALHDIRDVQRTTSRVDRLLGTSTIVVHSTQPGASRVVLAGIRRGAQLAAVIELSAADRRALPDADAVAAALAWEPRTPSLDLRGAVAGFFAVLAAIFAVVIGLHGTSATVTFAADDAIAPNGVKRSQADITAFMEREVMPWARATLGRLKGGADRITCLTCHGSDAEARRWAMPAVAALPQPDVKDRGWETYTSTMDAQMRNAIYGYLAESDNQAKAAYMREVVMPGMAALLHRPAYDFTRSYEENRSRRALGCYHCHRVQ